MEPEAGAGFRRRHRSRHRQCGSGLRRPPIWIGSGCWCHRSRSDLPQHRDGSGFGSADLDTGKTGVAWPGAVWYSRPDVGATAAARPAPAPPWQRGSAASISTPAKREWLSQPPIWIGSGCWCWCHDSFAAWDGVQLCSMISCASRSRVVGGRTANAVARRRLSDDANRTSGRGEWPAGDGRGPFPVRLVRPRTATVGGRCCAWVFGVCPGTSVAGTPVGRRRRCGLPSPSGAAAGGDGRTAGPGSPDPWDHPRPSDGCGDPDSAVAGDGSPGTRSHDRAGTTLGADPAEIRRRRRPRFKGSLFSPRTAGITMLSQACTRASAAVIVPVSPRVAWPTPDFRSASETATITCARSPACIGRSGEFNARSTASEKASP